MAVGQVFMASAAVNLSRNIEVARALAEDVEDVARAVSNSSCIHIEASLVELEAALASAVPQWMSLCVLLGLLAVILLLDACHAVQLVNVSRGLTKRTARPIYKPPMVKAADVLEEFSRGGDEDVKTPPAVVKAEKKKETQAEVKAAKAEAKAEAKEAKIAAKKAGADDKGEAGSEAKGEKTTPRKAAARSVATDFGEDLLLDPSRFENAPGRAGAAQRQAKVAWGSGDAFRKASCMGQGPPVCYEGAGGRRPSAAPRGAPPPSASSALGAVNSPSYAPSSAPWSAAATPSGEAERRGPRGNDRRVSPISESNSSEPYD